MTDLVTQGVEHAEGFLSHYGVKGMRWGVRRDKTPTSVTIKERPGKKVKTKGGKYQPPSEDAIRVANHRQKARKSTTDSLSTKELQELVNRMNLEQQYDRLDGDRANLGKQFAKAALQNGGADLAVKGLAKGAAKAGLAANPQVALGLQVAGMLAKGASAAAGKKKK